jgi:hypothetical protein
MKTASKIPMKTLSLALALFLPLAGAIAGLSGPRQHAPDRVDVPPPQNSESIGAALYRTDAPDQEPDLPPTRISLMTSRHSALRYTLDGYHRSKVPLVAFDGTNYFKAGFGDDPGIYYFIPQLAALSGLPLERSIDLFFGTILAVSLLSGIAGFLSILNRWPLKLWSVFALCMLLWFCYRKGDIYIALSAPAVAIVPWVLHLLKKNAAGAGMATFLFGVGLLAGFANEMRSHAATGLMIFVVILVAFEWKRGWGRKLALLAALLAGMTVSVAYFDALLARRDAYVATVQPLYTPTVDHHSIWHALYIGLGFIKNNPYVPDYRDEVAKQTVHSISPSTPFLSPEYERILRNEFFRIVREHPGFILVTLIAKLRFILFLLLCWCNFGLLAAAFYPKDWAEELAFWSALAFTSLFGIIAIPQIQYMLGFMAFATLYGIVSLDFAFERHRPGEIHTRLHSLAQKLRLA